MTVLSEGTFIDALFVGDKLQCDEHKLVKQIKTMRSDVLAYLISTADSTKSKG